MLARFIVLEGIDQSGKKTQTRLLVRRLREGGLRVSTIGFPVYSTPCGREIRRFLEGRRKLPFPAVHMLYSLNRWENSKVLAQRLAETDFLVADRYTASNLAYGTARGLDVEWLVGLDKGLPIPDSVIVIDVPVPSSFQRKRAERDVHESNRALLARVRANYLKLAKRFHWHIVKGDRPVQEVQSEIWKTLRVAKR